MTDTSNPTAAIALPLEDFPIEDDNNTTTSGSSAAEGQTPERRIDFDSRRAENGGGSDGSEPPCETPRRHRRRGCFWTVFILIIAVALAAVYWFRYASPYAEDCVQRGYITNIEKRGLVFKTYEGEMRCIDAMADTSRTYDGRPMLFSIPDRDLALRLQKVQNTLAVVTLTYERYYGILPWRGASRLVVTAAEIEPEKEAAPLPEPTVKQSEPEPTPAVQTVIPTPSADSVSNADTTASAEP
ncbi:MAG: hypothetical protein NC336_09830 [Clostridium sp.]|nr:hypothetical protein [Clostridium sp.]